MSIDKDFVLFDDGKGGKTYSNVMKDIYTNTRRRSKQIERAIAQLSDFITDEDTAKKLGDVLKGVLDVAVKNDDQLVKLAAIIQRGQTKDTTEGLGGGLSLSPEERESLIEQYKESIGTETDTSDVTPDQISPYAWKIDLDQEENDTSFDDDVYQEDDTNTE